MNLNEAMDILRDTSYKWSFQAAAGEQSKIIFDEVDDKIIFTDKGAYYKYRTYDNCSECGSPTNWKTKTKEITKKDLREMVQND